MEFTSLSSFLVIVTMVMTLSSAEISRGTCPDTGSVTTFDPSRYAGVWFEYKRFASWFEMGATCVSANYTTNDDGTMKMVNSGVRRMLGLNFPIDNEGTLFVPDPAEPGEFQIGYSRRFNMGGPSRYIIVQTDYENYSVVYSCTYMGFADTNIHYVWVLTRVRGEANVNLSPVMILLSNAGLDVNNFQLTDQTNCP